MKKNFTINVSRPEALRRYVLGSGLIGAVLVAPTIPAWVALLGCYPIFTAMIQWDPINAVMHKAVAKSSKGFKEAMFRGPSAA